MKTEKNYRTVPNQKTIVNNVKTEGRYYQVDEATFTLGCTELKPTTFLVWQALHLQYFTEQKLALSTSVISELMGKLRIPTIRAAINELIEKGWMAEISPNCYELINPVVRKAYHEDDDVVRKAYHAWNEKRTTGGTESVLEIRIKEEEKKTISRTETVEKEEDTNASANAAKANAEHSKAAKVNEINSATFDYDTAVAQKDMKAYYNEVASTFNYAADMRVYILPKENGVAYSTKPFANGSGYIVRTVDELIKNNDGCKWSRMLNNTTRDSCNSLLDVYEYKRAACYYFLSTHLK